MKHTVTVGIPAHNEEANIGRLLDAILQQTGDNFTLEKVVIVTDGCTDATEAIVKEAAKRDMRVGLLSDGERRGKASRLNQLYRLNQSDCLVTFDADVLLGHERVIDALAAKLFEAEGVVMAAGNHQPLPARTWIERLLAAQSRLWQAVRLDFLEGDNIYNSSGQAYALRKDFLRSLALPAGTVNDQELLYALAKEYGGKCGVAREALVWFRFPATWQDVQTQAARLAVPTDSRIDRWKTSFPWRHKIASVRKSFQKQPIATLAGLGAHIACEIIFPLFRKSSPESVSGGIWESPASSKKLVSALETPRTFPHLRTLSIGISAHNEEHNIGALLDSIISQRQGGYVLEKVTVACDGCTDGTFKTVKQYLKRLPVLQSADDGKRFGKSQRISQFFMDNTSDILVVLDADTTLGLPTTLANIVAEFASDPRVGMVAGGDRPYPPRTFFESIAVTVVDLWREMRQGYNGGDTVHNSHGCVLAFSRALTAATRIPKDTNGEDHYTYFRSKELQLAFRYARKAIVYYREPDSLKDFVKQRNRFHMINGKMIELFGSWTEAYYAGLPLDIKLCALIKMFVRRPLRLPLALALEVFMRVYIYSHQPAPVGGVWETVQSTKH